MRVSSALILAGAGLMAAGVVTAGAQADTAAGPVVYACVHSGTFNRVHLGTPRACATGDAAVSWQGLPSASPSPSPSATAPAPSPSPTTAPPSPSPSPTAPSGAQCVVTQPTGTPCGLAADPAISNSNGSNTQAGNNCWADPSCTFTSTFYSAARWDTRAREPAGNTSVMAYPTVQQLYDYPAVASLPSLTSTWAETMNATSGTIAWAAYDVWLNSWGVEVLVAVDNHGIDPAYLPSPGTITAGGQSFTLYRNGSERIAVLQGNQQSGAVDLAAVLAALTSDGQIPAGATLDAVDFGWEICSTGGQAEDFQVTGYTLSDN